MDRGSRQQVAAWLLLCCTMLFTLVVVGGITRLTHSGLSIVEWQPLVGTLPPLSEQAWHETFEKYQETPEYQKVNRGMSLDEFKGIFWWEYAHRLLGRAIGLIYLVPFLYLLLRNRLDRARAWQLGAIFLLGGLQGAMGWYMVKSGLVDDPHVSQYRLTAHLALAFAIYAAMLWVALGLLMPRGAPPREAARRGLWRFSLALTAIVFVMALSGGLVAGIRAGFAYNTFPLMNGRWVPPEILLLEPWHSNFFTNMATVQFDHRLIAWLLAALVPWFWWRSTRVTLTARARVWCNALLAVLVLQISLGILTLLFAVPVALGAAHQAGALLLLTVALIVNHQLQLATAAGGQATAQARDRLTVQRVSAAHRLRRDPPMPRKRINVEDFLSNLPLFRELGADAIARIATGSVEVDVPRGSVLFHRGDPCHGFHIVIFGQIKLAVETPKGDEKVIELIGPGMSFGEPVMFLGKPYMVSATTLADSLLLHVASDVVCAGIESDPGFARRIIAGLSRRLQTLINDLEAVSLRSGTQRVIGYLLRDNPEPGATNTLRVTLPAKKGVIASRLNLTHEHFSRILHELIEARLIDVEGLQVTITDIARLRSYGDLRTGAGGRLPPIRHGHHNYEYN